jgi:hypothetical protein
VETPIVINTYRRGKKGLDTCPTPGDTFNIGMLISQCLGIEMSEVYEYRCKVCTSPNRKDYEAYYLSEDHPNWKALEEKAKVFGEEISYRGFERHFQRHFSKTVASIAAQEEGVNEVVDEAKKEVLSTVDEIRSNLNGLKTLLNTALESYENKALTPPMLKGLTELYREHRQSIEACDRLTGKLTEGLNLSEADILKLLYIFAKDLCPDCQAKFKVNLDEYLRKRKNGV